MLRDYEIMVLLSPEITDEELPEAVERVQRTIGDLHGEVVSADPWGGTGKRRLVYPINRFRDAWYYLMHVKLDSGQTDALERSFRINERIIRHLMIHKGE